MNKKFNQKTNDFFIQNAEPYEGETIEEKIERLMTTEGAVAADMDAAPIYTEKKNGVMPEYNVRSDKWDIALEAMDEVNMAKRTQSQNNANSNNAEGNNSGDGNS